MSLTECQGLVGSDGRELARHGTTAFPVACYNDDLSIREVPWHWHEELEVVVIARGCCTVATDTRKFTVKAGEGFFVNSGILHGCWDLENSRCLFHSLVFHPRLVGGSLDSAVYQNYVQPLTENHGLESLHLTPEVPWQALALDAIERAWQVGVQEPYGYEMRLRNALSDLVLLIQENLPNAAGSPGTKALRDAERIKAMLQYIHSHCDGELNTRVIAGAAAISESECLRCFRATIGTTPIQYVRQYRIQKAAQLLTGTRESIAAISEQCGFQDVSYFTKTFREMKGCSPAVFRKR